MAPEVIRNELYDSKVDIYSFGIIIWGVCTGKFPYQNYSNTYDIKKLVLSGGRPSENLLSKNTPEKIIRLMRMCWDSNPSIRPNAEFIIMSLKNILFGIQNNNFII
jgi:serine/threonine protein kinase